MTETRNVAIDEVRALVGERQRYDDWLTALDGRRAETPTRVFERVRDDYVARRQEVIGRLREHVSDLARLGGDLRARLESVEARLAALEEERAEAMLRMAVGEFDAERWERVRQDVEGQMAHLNDQRSGLQAEGDEVHALLSRARPEPESEAPVALAVEPAFEATPEVTPSATALPAAEAHSAEYAEAVPDAEQPTSHDWLGTDALTTVEVAMPSAVPSSSTEVEPTPIAAAIPTQAELAELDDALALFSADVPSTSYTVPTPMRSATVDEAGVFDADELGDLRMTPPVRATATPTPNLAPPVGTHDGFDDLAFLRSVVDPTAPSGLARTTATTEQQKTLRCTECGTMNLPTEWYCERCGGELAAF